MNKSGPWEPTGQFTVNIKGSSTFFFSGQTKGVGFMFFVVSHGFFVRSFVSPLGTFSAGNRGNLVLDGFFL